MNARQPYRINRGSGAEDLRFTFDGASYLGEKGDTLASALLANGVRTVARSAELGRPRGIFTAGAAEPNAFVHVGGGQRSAEPMVAATRVPLIDGLEVHSLSGKGRVVPGEPLQSDKAHVHCDVLVIGGGPAGLAAARAARGRVVLIDEQPELGGDLLTSGLAQEWLAETVDALGARILLNTTAIGYYDHNYVVAASANRLWHIRAEQVVLATGAIERPIAFSGNDRPGVMLANSVRTYIRRHGVLPGRTAVVFTCTDSGYAAALDLLEAGARVAAIADPRVGPCGPWADRLWRCGVPVLRGHMVFGTEAGPAGELAGVLVAAGGDVRAIECDLLAVSGGWDPAVQLYRQAQGRVRFDDRIHAFVPADPATPGRRCAGACRGVSGTAAAIADGYGGAPHGREIPAAPDIPEPIERPPAGLWTVPARDHEPQFADLHRDVTVADLKEAIEAGLRSPQHIKRYTTAGTGPDQGRTAITHGVLAELLGGNPEPPSVRPPVAPVSFGLMAGRERGPLYDPVRLTPMHEWHVANGAVFENVGHWKRPWYFPRDGESMEDAVARECRAARTGVAAIDASTLGKIDVRGPDAAAFLDRVYVGRMSNLAPGRCRYGIMCGPDGMVLDDGVTARISDDRFHMTTTTGNAQAVLDHLEEWLQTEWPSLRVRCTPVTDHWATVAIAGPRSPEVVAGLGVDPSMRFMDWRPVVVGGVAARVFRISFSGEVAYEINVPSWYGLALWEAVMALGATPYGTETMHVLRAEKGFVMVGQETDGTVSPLDLGFTRLRGDFIGRAALSRPDTARGDRRRLVGLFAPEVLPEGTQLISDGLPVGHVTSGYFSAAMDRPFALALISGDHETVFAPDRAVIAEITSPVFLPELPKAATAEVTSPVFLRELPEAATATAVGPPTPRDHAMLRRRSPLDGRAAVDGNVYEVEEPATIRLREVPYLPMAEAGDPAAPGPGWEALHLGPDWWLLVGTGDGGPDVGVDVSAQRTVLELSGPDAGAVLMTGCTLDLHPAAFEVGDCAQTLLARVPVVLHRREADVYRIFVRAGFAAYLAEWISGATDMSPLPWRLG